MGTRDGNNKLLLSPPNIAGGGTTPVPAEGKVGLCWPYSPCPSLEAAGTTPATGLLGLETSKKRDKEDFISAEAAGFLPPLGLFPSSSQQLHSSSWPQRGHPAHHKSQCLQDFWPNQISQQLSRTLVSLVVSIHGQWAPGMDCKKLKHLVFHQGQLTPLLLHVSMCRGVKLMQCYFSWKTVLSITFQKCRKPSASGRVPRITGVEWRKGWPAGRACPSAIIF